MRLWTDWIWDRYLEKLDAVDAEEPEIREVTAKGLKQKIAAMEAKMEELKVREAEVEAHPNKQVSSTDPDARSTIKPDVSRRQCRARQTAMGVHAVRMFDMSAARSLHHWQRQALKTLGT